MAGKDMVDTKFLTDAGLDETTAEKLVIYGVKKFQDLAVIDFEKESFKKLELNEFQVNDLEQLKERAQRLQKFHKELEGKGLNRATQMELDKHGVVNNETLKVLSDPVITEMTLQLAQRELLKKIIKDFKPREESGMTMVNKDNADGNVQAQQIDHLDMSKRNFARGNKGPITQNFAEQKAENRGENTVKNLLPPKPKDLVLETTDELIAAMSDGPLSGPLQVQPCSQDFYSKHKAEAYSMEKTPRGGVLIINVKEVKGMEPRDGTDVDRDKLEKLFVQLGFHPTVYNDSRTLSAQEIKDKVQAFAENANREQGEAYVVCLLSHGEKNSLYGTDGGLLPFDTVFSLFGSKHCPNLEDKPKMFFIQACREGEPCLEENPKEGGRRRNMFVSYATQAGYEAFRNEETGSWLVEAITKVFAHFAHEEDIVRMMYRVHYAVQQKRKNKTDKKEDKDEDKDQIPEIRLNMKKPLFFFPGIQK